MTVRTLSYENNTCVFDSDTGEVFYFDEGPRKKVVSIEKYVGEEVKYPYECKRKDQLEDTLSQLDAYFMLPAKINYQFLLDSMVNDSMGKQEMSVLKTLAENVHGWNIFIGTAKEVAALSKTDPGNVTKVFKESKHIRALLTGKAPKGEWVLEVNPLLVWKGDLEYRENRLMRWYI